MVNLGADVEAKQEVSIKLTIRDSLKGLKYEADT